MPGNFLATELWGLLHLYDRPHGFSSLLRIPTMAMIKMAESYDNKEPSKTLFEKMLTLEHVAYPFILEASKNKEGE